MQIFDVLNKLLQSNFEESFSSLLVIGGKKLDRFSANIIIGTPGKLTELIDKDINFKNLEMLILGTFYRNFI